MLARRIERRVDEVELQPVVDRRRCSRCRRGRGRPRRRERRPLHRRARRGDARERERRGRREPARQPGAAQALALPRRARGPRLRHAGRRQGGGGAGARPPAGAQAGALGAAADGRGRRAGDARRGADAAGRGRRLPARDPLASTRGSAATRPRRARARRGARAAPRRSSWSSPRRSRCSSRSGSRGAAARSSARGSTLERERALEGDEVDATELNVALGDRAARPLELARAAGRLEVAKGENPVALRLGRGRGARARS